MKDHRLQSIWPLFLFVALSISSSLGLAYEVWNLPIESELKTLKITNLTSQPQILWLGSTSQRIPAFATENLPLNEFTGMAWMLLKSESSQRFQLQIETSFETLALLQSGSQTRWKARIRPNSELVIFNQAPFEISVKLESPNGFKETRTLKAFEKIRFPVASRWVGDLVTISSDSRIGGFLISPSGPKAFIPDPAPVVFAPGPEAKYFRLTNKSATQSYVVALTDPDQIAQARKQIENPKAFLPRILLGKVSFGHGNTNRDFSSPNRSPWSWHISEVYRFAELASQECDGNPQMLEETLGSWVAASGTICFWSYRIVEELNLQQVSKGR